MDEPLFSGGIEKWSSYDGAMIGWRVDLEESRAGIGGVQHFDCENNLLRFGGLLGYGHRSCFGPRARAHASNVHPTRTEILR